MTPEKIPFETKKSVKEVNVTGFKGKRKIFLITILSLLIVATVCFVILIPIFTARSQEEAIIRIPANADKETVKDSLEKYMGEKYASLVMRAALLHGSDFSGRHGAYKIEKDISPFKAERKLSKGAQYPVKIIVNGEKTPRRLAEKIAARLDFSPDSLIKAMENPELLNKFGLKKEQAIALLPEATYEVYWNVSPEKLLEKTSSHYALIWNDERKKKAADLGLSPAEIMTLCSMVDEETLKADDKGKIGRLYLNRLKKGMKLQADPTVKYAIGDFALRRIRNVHTKFDSPYNTYMVFGLPPGPIRTTSVATIDSVLNSTPSSYIYMCAREDFSGYHNFASTYEQHLKNARKYQQALNRRGIK